MHDTTWKHLGGGLNHQTSSIRSCADGRSRSIETAFYPKHFTKKVSEYSTRFSDVFCNTHNTFFPITAVDDCFYAALDFSKIIKT